jgi:hypothetical protein
VTQQLSVRPQVSQVNISWQRERSSQAVQSSTVARPADADIGPAVPGTEEGG